MVARAVRRILNDKGIATDLGNCRKSFDVLSVVESIRGMDGQPRGSNSIAERTMHEIDYITDVSRCYARPLGLARSSWEMDTGNGFRRNTLHLTFI